MNDSLLNGQLTDIINIIAAISALGTAAFGLVETSKVFWGGVSRIGFGHIEEALRPFAPALAAAVGPANDWRRILRAHWLNGRPKDEQKAIAKSLLRLGLSAENARDVAVASRVDTAALSRVVAGLEEGRELEPQELNVLGRFDAAVEAVLDSAFERAEQQYGNFTRSLAAVFAFVLSVAAGAIIQSSAGKFHPLHYFTSMDFLTAVVIGIVAVPIAPIAKDLVSTLTAATQAMRTARR